MVGGQLDSVIHYLRQLTGGANAADPTDAQLLERFIQHQEAAAFEALLGRHGPLVWSVCRTILHDAHDAEDAFQATFLVLVHKARSIRKHTALRCWLHGVAYRIAVQARVNDRKRRSHERQGVDMEAAQPLTTAPGADLGPALHEELARLPEKYRLPLLLCYLEQRTYEEAARALGWPLGTLKKRLTDGRQLLRRRLVRHGRTLSAGALATVLSENVATAAVPMALMKSTLQAALLTAAGQAAGAVSAPVAALTKGAIHAMFVNKMKTAAAVLLLALLGVGSALTYQHLARAQAASQGPEAQPARDNAQTTRPDAMYVIVKAQLYEVDDAVAAKLNKFKRVPWEELEQQFLAGKVSQDDALFKLLNRQKVVQAGKEVKLDNGQEESLLSRHQEVRCLPSPEQIKKGAKAGQKIQEGVSFRGRMHIGGDRRYVRLKLTEKTTEIEEIKKIKMLEADGGEAEAEMPFLKETVQSRVVEIPDGGSLLLPVVYRPQAARMQDRSCALLVHVRIYIEAEERDIRRQEAREPSWGKAVQGVQCRLRADRLVWQKGEIPSFKAEIRNQGQREFSVAQAQELCELEIDGQTYRWQGPIDVKSSALGAGRHYEGIAVVLGKDWHGVKSQKPIQLAAGKHRIRVVFQPIPILPREGTAKLPEVRVVSNAVPIEILAATGL